MSRRISIEFPDQAARIAACVSLDAFVRDVSTISRGCISDYVPALSRLVRANGLREVVNFELRRIAASTCYGPSRSQQTHLTIYHEDGIWLAAEVVGCEAGATISASPSSYLVAVCGSESVDIGSYAFVDDARNEVKLLHEGRAPSGEVVVCDASKTLLTVDSLSESVIIRLSLPPSLTTVPIFDRASGRKTDEYSLDLDMPARVEAAQRAVLKAVRSELASTLCDGPN